MNDKSTFYLSITVILIFFFSALEKVTVEFIKSANPPSEIQKVDPPEQSPMEMLRKMFPHTEMMNPRELNPNHSVFFSEKV